MRNPDQKLVTRFRTAPDDAAALGRFVASYQHAIYSGGLDLPNAFFQANIREPWKTLAGTHQIWAWIGADGFHHFAEDRDMICFDPVVRAGLELLGLGGYEVIRAFREDVAEHPEFWNCDWQCHIPADPGDGRPVRPSDQRACAILDRYSRYWLRFWSRTWCLEDHLADFLKRSGGIPVPLGRRNRMNRRRGPTPAHHCCAT
jgi:hypothetical protein